jgi:hypothetical protein
LAFARPSGAVFGKPNPADVCIEDAFHWDWFMMMAGLLFAASGNLSHSVAIAFSNWRDLPSAYFASTKRARNEVLQWQSELRTHQDALSIIGTPIGYYKLPDAIERAMPSFKTTGEYEAFNAKFAHGVADVELMVTKLKDRCQQWTRLTMEQQNRKLILALTERM